MVHYVGFEELRSIATSIADHPDGDRGPNLNKLVPLDTWILVE